MDTSALRVVDTGPLPYLLSVPVGPEPEHRASPAERWPVLCFLHGYGEGAPTAIDRALTRHGPLRRGNASQPSSTFVVVAPQLPQRGDLWYRHAAAVRRIVATVQEEQHGDSRRTYLSGFSFGGNGVFDLALSQPELWAALWAVDPTRHKQAFIRTLNLQPFREQPDGNRLYRDPGLNHVETARHAYDDDQIYRWLLSKHLPSPA